MFGGTRRYYRDITEHILVLRNLSLYNSTRKYYKTYTGTSYLILVLRSISWSYGTYTYITELFLYFDTQINPVLNIHIKTTPNSSSNGGLELHIHLVTSNLLKSYFNTYVSSKLFHEYSQTTLIWVITDTQNQAQRFVRVYSKP